MLPVGVTWTDDGDGTATLSGTPSDAGSPISFSLTIEASNGIEPAITQAFTLFVNE